NFLAYISVGDTRQNIERLIGALSEIKRRYQKEPTPKMYHTYMHPLVVMSPREAFYAEKRRVLISQSVGEIACEFVMCYPPGIPILAPGEQVTKEIAEYILYAKEKGCSLTGTEDLAVESILVWKGDN
ncbi:MAG TPA: arginine decarboxylase, partial [Clostridiales bacterium]|nr:arginine decarboxylase [Clostridiales bacterium]